MNLPDPNGSFMRTQHALLRAQQLMAKNRRKEAELELKTAKTELAHLTHLTQQNQPTQ